MLLCATFREEEATIKIMVFWDILVGMFWRNLMFHIHFAKPSS
jgi:hypothetical protein